MEADKELRGEIKCGCEIKLKTACVCRNKTHWLRRGWMNTYQPQNRVKVLCSSSFLWRMETQSLSFLAEHNQPIGREGGRSRFQSFFTVISVIFHSLVRESITPSGFVFFSPDRLVLNHFVHFPFLCLRVEHKFHFLEHDVSDTLLLYFMYYTCLVLYRSNGVVRRKWTFCDTIQVFDLWQKTTWNFKSILKNFVYIIK